jgi:superfamily II DNA or RNA helicase
MITLRPYQDTTVLRIRAAAAKGARAICVVLPTGAGKTLLHAAIIRRAHDRGKRALWLCPLVGLVDQTVAAIGSLGIRAGALSPGAESAAVPDAMVQVATVQALITRGTRPAADIVIADEAHHYCAEDWAGVLRAYSKALILGPTATPERSDGVGLGAVFDRLVLGPSPGALIAGGFLVPPDILRPAKRLKSSQIALRPCDAYRQHAAGRKALVFCARVEGARKAMQDFRIAGLGADLVTADTPPEERRDSFAALRAGRIAAVVGVGCFGEGLDVPEADCVILSRQFATAGAYLQAAGRGLRPAPGKSDLLILDLAGTTHIHGSPADDREFSLEGRGIRKATDGVASPYCRVCGAPIAPGAACEECGAEAREVKDLKVVNAPLVKYAAKRAEPIDKRVATLARWIAEGRARGFKPKWASVKYSAVYGRWPESDITAAAMAAADPKTDIAPPPAEEL